MDRTKRLLIPFALLSTVVVAACGNSSSSSTSTSSGAVDPNAKEVSPPGDIPDNQAFVAYRPPGASFTVKVPEGWARVTNNGAITFTDKLNSIAIESRTAGSGLSAAEVRRTELPKLAGRVNGFSHPRVSVVSRHAGKAVLMVSSYLPELLGVCDRIAVMCRGRLGEARPVEELTEHQIMLEATGATAQTVAV